MDVTAIVAVGECGEIGKGGGMPWPKLRHDLGWFVRNTAGKTLIMGRKTYESIPVKPLDNARSIVVLSRGDDAEGLIRQLDQGRRHLVSVARSLEEALAVARNVYGPREAILCGGAAVYREGLESGLVSAVYLTKVSGTWPGSDAFFPYDLLASDSWQETPAFVRYFEDRASGIVMGFYRFGKRAAFP